MFFNPAYPLSLLSLLSHLAASASAATTCGLKGSHSPGALTQYMGNFFYNGASSFALCAAWCKNDASRCRSFRYSYWGDANAQYCEFFEGALDNSVTADKNQPYWYYDIACGFPDFMARVTVTTTTTAAGGGGGAGGAAGQTVTVTVTTTSVSSVLPSTPMRTQTTTLTVARQTVTRAMVRTRANTVTVTRMVGM